MRVEAKLHAAFDAGYVGFLVYDYIPDWRDATWSFDTRPSDPLAGPKGCSCGMRSRTPAAVLTLALEAFLILRYRRKYGREPFSPPVKAGRPRRALAAVRVSCSTCCLHSSIGRPSGTPTSKRRGSRLSVLAERRLVAGQSAELTALLPEIVDPPVADIGVLAVNSFLKKRERSALAASLNTLLGSPTFASWRQGAPLDIASWVKPEEGATPCTIVSVAHLDDEERALVLGIVLEEILSWVRGLRGTSMLRALVVFDEAYGFLPPYPANPRTKRPVGSLMKQARAFGVGVVLATQNPMDLDYRAFQCRPLDAGKTANRR